MASPKPHAWRIPLTPTMSWPWASHHGVDIAIPSSAEHLWATSGSSRCLSAAAIARGKPIGGVMEGVRAGRGTNTQPRKPQYDSTMVRVYINIYKKIYKYKIYNIYEKYNKYKI